MSFSLSLTLRHVSLSTISRSTSRRLGSTSSRSKQAQNTRARLAQASQIWNPTIRALASKSTPTLILQTVNHLPRNAARVFISASCFVVAGNGALIVADPPQGFSPFLRKFLIVAVVMISCVGAVALSRNMVAIKSITAIPGPIRGSGIDPARSVLLRLETTRSLFWWRTVVEAEPQKLHLSQPIHVPQKTSSNKSEASSPIRIALTLPGKIMAAQFRHLWHALRAIAFSESPQLSLEGVSQTFIIDEDSAFALNGGATLNSIVRQDRA